MSTSENTNSREVPPGVSPSTIPPFSKWTLDGYPIVDGKYHDLATDEIKTHTGVFSGGPPSLTIYWNNCGPVNRSGQFFSMGCMSPHTVTEYVARVGEMLRQGKVTITSLNATKYSVNVIIVTELSREEFIGLLREHGLVAAS